MLALIGYPFLIEPLLRLVEPAVVWVGGYALLGALVALCAVMMWALRPGGGRPALDAPRPRPRARRRRRRPVRRRRGGQPVFLPRPARAGQHEERRLRAARRGDVGPGLLPVPRPLAGRAPAVADFVSVTEPQPRRRPPPRRRRRPAPVAPSHNPGHGQGGTAVKTAPRSVTREKAAAAPAAQTAQARAGRQPARRRQGRSPGAAAPLDRPGGGALQPHARRHDLHHDRHRGHPAAVDAAADPVPADVHHRLRGHLAADAERGDVQRRGADRGCWGRSSASRSSSRAKRSASSSWCWAWPPSSPARSCYA